MQALAFRRVYKIEPEQEVQGLLARLRQEVTAEEEQAALDRRKKLIAEEAAEKDALLAQVEALAPETKYLRHLQERWEIAQEFGEPKPKELEYLELLDMEARGQPVNTYTYTDLEGKEQKEVLYAGDVLAQKVERSHERRSEALRAARYVRDTDL